MCVLLMLYAISASVIARTVSLADYARAGQPLKIYTVPQKFDASGIPLLKSDQINNFKEGDHVLPLSDKKLTDLKGISTLKVEFGGKIVPIITVPRLQLFFNKNDLHDIPAEIGRLENVIFIYFKENKLTHIPPAIAGMKSLQGMYFTDNKITEIPPEVFTLAGLRKLEIAGNQLSVLPREVGNLTKLIHFRLDKNKLTSLPDSISNLKELRVVDFSDNDLAEIPQAFAEVSIRYELRLRGNKKLRTLPYGKGFASMTAAIDIKDTGIDPASLPPEIRARTEATRPPGAYAKALAERGETKKTARDK
ncbi:hypothetical protein AW736_05625 [Termitidicoccus mucosus]|uniref:Leucine-rich repeat domain-containing protein n=2 Tax=Termitidicoccus mucosus TaxID=1184151 RepID=A0A178INR7_9BACT|nr:hypothetical protein AW736_05625 [Opitutaceae bacterium TSB47]